MGTIFLASSIYLGVFLFPTATYSTQLPEANESGVNNLFLPFARLVYGPNTTQVVDLTYRYAELYDYNGHEKLLIHNPQNFVPSEDISQIPTGKSLLIVFDSYFLPNLQKPQIIPKISGLQMNFTKILNPLEAADITQMELGQTIKLPILKEDAGNLTNFIIPQNVDAGHYLVDVFVPFLNDNVGAVYSTKLIVNSTNSSNLS